MSRRTVQTFLISLSTVALFISFALPLAKANTGVLTVAPFDYPTTLLDAPATLSDPKAAFARLGKPVVKLEQTPLTDVVDLTHAVALREGSGVFKRDYVCLQGTEGGEKILLWLIASNSPNVTEAQLQSLSEDQQVPEFCQTLPPELLPLRLGKIGLGMYINDIKKTIGTPSYVDSQGWHYWFSQRFLRNARNLQELELNWLAVKVQNGRAIKAFASKVTNP